MICLSILIMGLIYSCNLEGYEEAELDENAVNGDNEPLDKNKVLPLHEIKDLAVGSNGGYSLKNNMALWGYESGYQWLEGEHYRDSSMFNFYIKKVINGIYIDLKFDLEALQPFPTVYDYKFNQNDEADYLNVEMLIGNDQNSKKIKLTDNVNISANGLASFDTALELKDFKDFPVGIMEYTLEVRTTLTSFFDIRSKIKPITAKLCFNFQVPQLYKTELSFKALRLNKEETRKVLGDNDFSNGAPETGILVLYNGNSELYEYTKNSYSYLKKHKVAIYHLSPDDFVEIRALDVDYGFNANDIIKDTTLSLKSLEGTDYINLKMKCVDELLLFTQFKGKAN